MKISHKLWLNLLLLGLLGIGFFFLQLWNQNLSKGLFEDEKLFDKITLTAFQLSLLSQEIALHPKEKRPLKQWRSEYQRLGKLLSSTSISLEIEKLEEWKTLNYIYKKLWSEYERLMRVLEAKSNISLDVYKERLERVVNSLFREAQNITTYASLVREKTLHNYQEVIKFIWIVSSILILVTTLSLLIVSFFIVRGITHGLNLLEDGTIQVTKGDLNYQVELNTKDELGEFAKAFNKMVIELKNNMMSKKDLEKIVKEKTEALKKSRMAAISIMEDANNQKKLTQKANDELQREIAIREETEKKLIVAKEEAESANRAKSIFLANMSHELRTPLNSILGFSELMKNTPTISQDVKHNLEIINRSGEHLLALINDVLDMSKIEAGHMHLNSEDFDFGIVIRDVVDMMQVRAKSKDIGLEFDQSSNFPRYINGDVSKLRQIFINLLSNSIKFTNSGGVKLSLDSRLLDDESEYELKIEVEDSGIGIAKESLETIFLPFEQVNSAQSEKTAQKGSGLGLALTKQFVEMMDGKIEVDSEVGKGSIFRVFVIAKRVKTKVAIEPNYTQKRVIGLKPHQKLFKILIVDDNPDNGLLLQKLLNEVGFETEVANNGKEAIEKYKSFQPNLIWMDRRMPIVDGLEATKIIRKLPNGKNVKIIALTASIFLSEKEELLLAGFDGFLRKPYRSEEIFDLIAKELKVNFIYEELKEGEIEDKELTPNDVAQIPKSIQVDILQAIKEGDRALLRDITEELKDEYPTIANKLKILIDKYFIDTIEKLFTQKEVK